jgi:hypothetical protein
MGGTGDSPVPVGDPPTGTARRVVFLRQIIGQFEKHALAVAMQWNEILTTDEHR